MPLSERIIESCKELMDADETACGGRTRPKLLQRQINLPGDSADDLVVEMIYSEDCNAKLCNLITCANKGGDASGSRDGMTLFSVRSRTRTTQCDARERGFAEKTSDGIWKRTRAPKERGVQIKAGIYSAGSQKWGKRPPEDSF
ncbi:hypothetical protein AVEN_197053-1 [Araneus ventricosus]|uniref:Uncharacterized protein n=1 Tax=Araneus ventricosus TaxID=182803 RepID=A0A4Y2HHH5_ARAVE|nr:hypothetical protein AVEN_197053-1 [Araneus ventricosus]